MGGIGDVGGAEAVGVWELCEQQELWEQRELGEVLSDIWPNVNDPQSTLADCKQINGNAEYNLEPNYLRGVLSVKQTCNMHRRTSTCCFSPLYSVRQHWDWG